MTREPGISARKTLGVLDHGEQVRNDRKEKILAIPMSSLLSFTSVDFERLFYVFKSGGRASDDSSAHKTRRCPATRTFLSH